MKENSWSIGEIYAYLGDYESALVHLEDALRREYDPTTDIELSQELNHFWESTPFQSLMAIYD